MVIPKWQALIPESRQVIVTAIEVVLRSASPTLTILQFDKINCECSC